VLLYNKIACVALQQNLLSWSDEALAPLEAEKMRVTTPLFS